MPILEANDRRVLFVHIPKAGGTAVVNAFRPRCHVSFDTMPVPSTLKVSPQHLPVGDIRAILGGEAWDHACAVIRDPYVRLESEYRFRVRALTERFGHRPDFSNWILQHLELAATNPCHLDNHLRPQTELIDHDVELFRHEDGLAAVVARIAALLGMESPPPTPVLNVGDPEAVVWSMPARIAVNRRYAADFEILRYPLIVPESNRAE